MTEAVKDALEVLYVAAKKADAATVVAKERWRAAAVAVAEEPEAEVAKAAEDLG